MNSANLVDRFRPACRGWWGLWPASARSATRAEYTLIAFLCSALLAAWWLPITNLPGHYHAFADQRPWVGIPHAMNILTNLPFAVVGTVLLGAVVRARKHLSVIEAGLGWLSGVGLVLTAAGSTIYHLHPAAGGLALDRGSMAVVFAGVVGLVVAGRVSERAGWMTAAAMLVFAPLAAWLDWHSANMTPWVVLQGSGMVLLITLALRPLMAQALPIVLWPVLLMYAVAKLLEVADTPVLSITDGLISGHSAKHLVAAWAVWPIAQAFAHRGRQALSKELK